MKRGSRVAEAQATYVVNQGGISPRTVRTVVDTIAERCKPEKIIVFGSCARNEAGPSSDLDLLVIMNSTLPRYKRAAPLRLLFNPNPCPMDILVFTPAEVKRWNGTVNHILTEILETGVIAYEKQSA